MVKLGNYEIQMCQQAANFNKFIKSCNFHILIKQVQSCSMSLYLYTIYMYCIYTIFLCLLSALVHKMHPFPPKNIKENSSSYLWKAGRFSKTFTAEILVQMAKYCLTQIKYLIIHVFYVCDILFIIHK